ncbi:LysM domain protein [compost metagenome]
MVFQQNLQTFSGPLASWTAWVVPTTMTAAQAAARVGMSESELRRVNNIPPRMRVRAGSSLLVPRSQTRNGDVPLHVADNGHLSLQPEVTLRRRSVRARKGDTLSRLASRYGVSAVSVAGWNRLAINARLKPGQRVTLMLPQRSAVASSRSAKKSVKVATRKKAVQKAGTRTAKARTSSKRAVTKVAASKKN